MARNRLGRGLIPPLSTTVIPPITVNQKKTPSSNAPWSTPTWPKLPSWPLPAYASSDITKAPAAEATNSLTIAAAGGSARRAHCCPTATPDDAPMMSSATHTGPSGGLGTAANTGKAGISPPNTVNELNVAKPMWALEPTATAAVPTITLGAYSIDSRVRLNSPKIESVMP